MCLLLFSWCFCIFWCSVLFWISIAYPYAFFSVSLLFCFWKTLSWQTRRRPPNLDLTKQKAKHWIPPMCLADPHLLSDGVPDVAGARLQQTQQPVPQPRPRRWRHPDHALPAAAHRPCGIPRTTRSLAAFALDRVSVQRHHRDALPRTHLLM